MNVDNAQQLIQTYIAGWKENDAPKILSTLAEDCIVIESHGPTYHGLKSMQHWLATWLAAKGVVTRWDILAFYYDAANQTACVQWDFCCAVKGVEYALPGVSIVKYAGDKIAAIHEYRMTQPAYDWDGEKLISE